MINTYKLAATISFHHQYYPENQLQDFQVYPSPETQRVLDASSIQIKQTGNQLYFFYPQQNQRVEPLKTLKSLAFYFSSLNPYFFNFTNLPLKDQEETFVFYNNLESPNLSIDPFVTESDLSSLYVDDHFNPQTHLGVIILDLSLPEEDQTPPSYQLNFAVRKTIWRYFLINHQPGQELTDLNIEAAGTDIHFSEGEEHQLPNGQITRLFIADDPLPFALPAPPKLNFNLNSGSNSINLPNPDPGHVKMEKSGSDHWFYSDIYVYL